MKRVVCADFDEQRWYQQLLDFGHGNAAEEDELIPTLVGNLVVPLALQAVRVAPGTPKTMACMLYIAEE